VDLEKAVSEKPLVSPEPAVTKELERPTKSNPMKFWGHVAFWSGAGLAVVGGVSAMLAVGAAKKYEDNPLDTASRDRSKLFTGVMFLGLGTGVAAMGTGVALWLLAPKDEPATTTSAAVVPTADGQGYVFAISGRW
jgi:hypothetical protein